MEENKNKFVDMTNIEQIQKDFMKDKEVKPKTRNTKKTSSTVKEVREKKINELKESAEKRKRGRPKNIESPELLLELFNKYVEHTKSNPFKVKDWVGKDAYEVKREKEKPLTMEGFENYCFFQGVISDLKDYFSNKGERYSIFTPICSRIREVIRQDQIEGGMAGLYNPSITQRLNGLTEKQEVTQISEQPLFPD